MIAWSSDLHKMIRWSRNFTVCTYPDPACACVHVKNLAEKKTTNATWFCQFHFRNFQHHFATKSLGTSQQQRILSRLNHFQKLMQKRTTVSMLVVYFVVQLFERKRVTQFNVMNMDQNHWESSMHVFQFLEIKRRIIILSTRKVLPQLFSTQSHRFPVALVLHPHPHTWRDRFLVGTKKQDLSWAMLRFQVCRKLFHWFFSVHSKAVTWVLVNEMMKRYQKQEVWFKWGCICYILYEECMSCTALYDMFLRFWNHMEVQVQDLHSVSNTEKITMHHGFQYIDIVYPRNYKTVYSFQIVWTVWMITLPKNSHGHYKCP